ncbi:MAG: metallophosphoesterase [Deltaproteobacteria bacterium]|nr:metallophosphoesterase [Deltaproteobacteria bacterium]
MKLYAISDLHVGHGANAQALRELPQYLDDWLIVAGDCGDKLADHRMCLELLGQRFAQLIWVPGNHDLWREGPLAGLEKYQRLVEICRELNVLTPEDRFALWPGGERPAVIAPLFTLYDYSFHPDDVTDEEAVAWAAEAGVICADEAYLSAEGFTDRIAWCAERCRISEQRLAALERPPGAALVLVNHWPLLRAHAVLPRIPRFSVWCGTRRSEGWAQRFAADVVVYGHLHIRCSHRSQGVRFEEVSLGYPAQWQKGRPLASYLREILPGPPLDEQAVRYWP